MLYLLISFYSETTRPPMPLGGKYFPTRLKVMHYFRTQHLKPFFGKSKRLAGKEKKVERKRMSRLWSEPGGYRRKKELGGRRKLEGEGGEGEAA